LDDDVGFDLPIAAPIKHNDIKMLSCSQSFRARCFKVRANARGNTMTERTLAKKKDKLTSTNLLSDQRGAVAFEMLTVWSFLMMFLLLPLADVAIAGFQYISAWQALRGFGQYIQYSNPPDPTNPGTWKSGLQTTVAGYTIGNLHVRCGDATLPTDCDSGNATLTLPNGSVVAAPKYFTFSTTITLAPMVLRRILCPSTCTYTLPYSERFQ
jgi:hypothetical protein